MSRRWLMSGIAAAATVGALVAVAPAAAKGAGGPGTFGAAPDSSTTTGPPGTDASSRRYAALAGGSTTTVIAIKTEGGAIAKQRALGDRWALPAVTLRGDAGGLSADGETLVLTRPSYGLASETRFLVLEGSSLRSRDQVTLEGQYAFDAISPDGRLMYLIEYPRPRNFTEYRVRAYDFAAGELRSGVVVDPDEAGEPMTGEPVSRAVSTDGRWAYTLYRGRETFVHALDTQEAEAVCIDLPQFEDTNYFALDLTVDPASGALTVLERGDPAVAIDPQTFEIGPASGGGASEVNEKIMDWLVAGLIGGGLLLGATVFMVKRRGGHPDEGFETDLAAAVRDEDRLVEREEERPREPVG